MPNEWIKARQTRYGAFAFVYVVVVLAIIVALNWLSDHHSKSLDVTANKRFTLADQTIKIASGLKKDINVYYFDKADNFDHARDMLDRYTALTPKLHVQYVDPDKKPDLARAEGMHNYGDIVFDSGEKKETAKGLTEEELTGAMVRVLKTGLRMACFVNGSGEHQLTDGDREGYAGLKDVLEKNNFKTDTISLLEKPEVPATCNIVVIGGPKRDYLQPEIDALRTYVKGGGHLLVNFDPVLDLPDGKMGDTPELAKFVGEYGITAKGDVVLDLGAASRVFGQLSPVAATYEQHPIVRVMGDNATVYPFSRSLEVKDPAEKLFSSSADSYSLTNPRIPIKDSDLDKAAKGPFILGAVATVGSGNTQGRVIVVGSSDWLSNNIINAPVANRDLVLNMMNWMTSDEDLISIRPKDPEDRRLSASGNALRVLFMTSIVFVPLFVILSGVSVWWKRR